MPIINKIKRIFIRHFMELRWQGVVIALLSYVGLSYFFLYLSGETDLLSLPDFAYWLVVTASTVGYGDFSPQTPAGKLAVSVFVIPFGLSLFALFVGRVAVFASYHWKKGVKGLKQLDCANHILVIGWNERRTPHLIRLLLREQLGSEETRQVVLCAKADIENPMPEEIGFVKVESYNNDAQMSMACLESASTIIIDAPEDDVTMTAALYCASRNKDAHMIAYFNDDNLSRLLKVHCPNIECTPSVDVELLAKSAMHPGSSVLHQDLLNVQDGMTQYSIRYPAEAKSVPLRNLFLPLKERYDAILIAVGDGKGAVTLNPPMDHTVAPGTTIYYIADERIDGLDWEKLCV
ncbi:Kef-type K+ transport system, predicted NAD-binding component [Hahella chejuensis KCTC 2396]|uniref:Kef-type K+ transport system, predicted NAD-binding component n=1 Tax=Hahella chejuensis (strain KCTC 2396) TaxID=349521 RepID=Q2S7Z1_HAHCH|nr:potassium channel family protein [Hahella chejuensis]ABC33233.1 Kef-type K+ transport system, predicted NAD-binding component [Hahella chejuensis KCTC 2396]